MANTVYANKVLEAKAKDLLTTSINTRNLMAVDEDLVENAGMTKTINTYTYAGEAEELAAGVGNTTAKRGNITYTSNDYTVKMVQQAFDYTDEDFMKDNTITFRITTEEKETLRQLAAKEDVSVSKLIYRIIKQYLMEAAK